MAAPQPKPSGMERDTFFKKEPSVARSDGAPLDLANLNGKLLGHFDAARFLRAKKGGSSQAG